MVSKYFTETYRRIVSKTNVFIYSYFDKMFPNFQCVSRKNYSRPMKARTVFRRRVFEDEGISQKHIIFFPYEGLPNFMHIELTYLS